MSCGVICDVLRSPESGSMQSDGTDLGCTTLDSDTIIMVMSHYDVRETGVIGTKPFYIELFFLVRYI